MKRIIYLASFLLIVLLLLFIASIKTKTVTIDDHQFLIDVAATPKEQEVGLSKYTSLPVNKGMYFTFSHSDTYRFWMKNMHFPIDIVFIRGSRIIDIVSSVPAPRNDQTTLPTYGPSSPADAVLEINGGLSEKYGFQTGDTVQLVQ